MAKINDLVKQVPDARLRRELETAVAELKKRTRFGLVYESHLPETTALPGLQIREGAWVVKKNLLSAKYAYRVDKIEKGIASLTRLSDKTEESAPLSDLVALQRFGDPIYPGLECVGTVEGSHQAIRPSGHQAIRPSGHQAIRPSGHQAIRPSGHQAIRPSGHIMR